MTSVVLLHGFAGQPQSWDAVVAELDPTWSIVRPTLPGHGLAAGAAPTDFDAAVERGDPVPRGSAPIHFSS